MDGAGAELKADVRNDAITGNGAGRWK